MVNAFKRDEIDSHLRGSIPGSGVNSPVFKECLESIKLAIPGYISRYKPHKNIKMPSLSSELIF